MTLTAKCNFRQFLFRVVSRRTRYAQVTFSLLKQSRANCPTEGNPGSGPAGALSLCCSETTRGIDRYRQHADTKHRNLRLSSPPLVVSFFLLPFSTKAWHNEKWKRSSSHPSAPVASRWRFCIGIGICWRLMNWLLRTVPGFSRPTGFPRSLLDRTFWRHVTKLAYCCRPRPIWMQNSELFGHTETSLLAQL
jgi:hypothetical protein